MILQEIAILIMIKMVKTAIIVISVVFKMLKMKKEDWIMCVIALKDFIDAKMNALSCFDVSSKIFKKDLMVLHWEYIVNHCKVFSPLEWEAPVPGNYKMFLKQERSNHNKTRNKFMKCF